MAHQHEHTVVGIQARMGSTRLPGKSLMSLGHQPMLRWVIDRVRLARCVDEVWILATTNPEDDAMEATFGDVVHVLRGDAHDVASRYEKLLQQTGATRLLRITGDCPLIDGRLLDKLVQLHDQKQAEYSHILAQSYYECSYPNGFNAELFTAAAFQKMQRLGRSAAAREHVTLPVDEHPLEFKIARLAPPSNLSRPHWKLSVDTRADFERISAIINALGVHAAQASVSEIVTLLDGHPEWELLSCSG